LAAIDADISDMQKLRQASRAGEPDHKLQPKVLNAISRVQVAKVPKVGAGIHSPPKSFRRGQPLAIETAFPMNQKEIRLRFRRVNQSEIWQAMTMKAAATGKFTAEIGADYTNSPFPLQYYFELHDSNGTVWFYPGLTPEWRGQPYFVVREANRLGAS
jgi:hypothetical protein